MGPRHAMVGARTPCAPWLRHCNSQTKMEETIHQQAANSSRKMPVKISCLYQPKRRLSWCMKLKMIFSMNLTFDLP